MTLKVNGVEIHVVPLWKFLLSGKGTGGRRP
jgi:hypothetical protein